MARHFTAASSEYIDFDTSAPLFQNWTWGTIAAWVKRASNGSSFRVIVGCDDGGADLGFGFLLVSSNETDLWSKTAGSDMLSTTTVLVADGWCLVGVTKTTGGTPRLHIYKQSANTWTHENGSGTQADNAFVGDVVAIGANHQVGGSIAGPFDGDIAAVLVLDQYSMTDSEIERLPSGAWDRYVTRQTDFYWESRSGRDTATAATGVASNDRGRVRSTNMVGTTLGATADPYGFRFSRLSRRR